MYEAVEDRLIKDVAGGDEDAFRQLFDLLSTRVFQYVLRLANNRQTAEDVMIDTFTEVWKSARNFRGQSKVSTWVIGISRNLAMNDLRKRKAVELELEDDVAYTATQFRDCSRAESAGIIREALDMLPIKHREVLDLVFLQDMSYEDISQVLDIPVNTVKTRVFHAKDKLREILKGRGIGRNDIL